jgi:ferric-dicitrate binding protein FerR (iron transport regulator)
MEGENLNRHAWRTGTLSFNRIPLSLVLKTISNNFGLEITVPTACDFPVTINYDGKNPVAVLETIASMDDGNLEELATDHYQLSNMTCGK